ncbi:MAG: TM1266 family iron-only hydrogenase system putative regulator [Eubacteriales bacterium]
MDTRIALVGIMLEDMSNAPAVNQILHDFSEYVVARMGVPCREKGLSVISLVVDAPQDVINHLSGKLGQLAGVNAKTIYSKV